MDYSELPGLCWHYLEDSYVLDIKIEPDRLAFRLEVVLTEDHPQYHQPGPGEQYCYANASLIFEDVSNLEWTNKNFRIYTDVADEKDMGNIDYLKKEDNHWRAGGDWGEVLIDTETTPELTVL